jgi:hypothetical protein
MRTIPTLILSLTLCALAAIGCGAGGGGGARYVQKGTDLYGHGDYAGALQVFEQVDASAKLSGKAQVRYLTYRGLAAAHAGRMDEAKIFLVQARPAYEAGDARWLSPEIVAEMDATLDKLGK